MLSRLFAIQIVPLLLLLCVGVTISCSGLLNLDGGKRSKLKEIKKWGYQLQGYPAKDVFQKIREQQGMLWVIDYSHSGEESGRFTVEQLKQLKQGGNMVVAYISIGEAEEVRYYYPQLPRNLIVESNAQFPDNHLVKFWQKEWQQIFISSSSSEERSYLDRIIDSGFDGIYLDIVDAFSYFPDKKKRAEQMKRFILKIADHCRQRNPDFIVIQQNATELINLIAEQKSYLKAIDGLGIEDLFFGGSQRNNNAWNIDKDVLAEIKKYQRAEKAVFSVEYIADRKKIIGYRELALKHHMVPLVAERELSGELQF